MTAVKGATEPEAESWLDTETPAARADIEIVEGINHQPVAFDPVTGHYTRLSRSGAAILQALDGTVTGREFACAVVRQGGHDHTAEQIVLAFLGELRAAGLLTVPPESGALLDGVRFARRRHMPRRALATGSINRLLEPPARALRRAPALFAVLWGLAAAAALWQTGHAITSPGAAGLLTVSGLTWGWALLALLIALQTTVHELSHALSCRYYGIPVREVGVGLLFYVLPAAYVDRTDAYRLADRRPRIVICMAGVAVDLLWIGAYAAVTSHSDGQLGRLAGLLMWLQLMLLMGNFNPLMPTDGYQALETALGTVNLRARALTVLRCLVLRRPQPSWLASRGRARRTGYLVFGAVCVAYALLILVMTVHALTLWIG
ncbi:PqqD family peptide modification chaperone [Streptomyces sp. ZAF1911]|uniref:PqqD family peptide modification chaperone n=1 Tax=Streptomyces sp. ZAF1911 TaxID=2944129 RepID=UPI00237A586E|nr:PqqD family peptide modification chaperone [Streptomyces sp. ZAF1911]MDD9375793.1 PqqD family peptide modification chaperone [Streptomyces sp. ZAF1911]